MTIKIKSKQNNFRRCGIPHPDQWTEYPDDKFTKEELVILKKEPMLIVEEMSNPKKYEDMNKGQLVFAMQAKGLEIPENATKAVMIDLLNEAEK
jgi:hypothetical protein